MKRLLFLCTGNYYRSRYAEILFNHRATERGLAWRAESRGFAPDPLNPGPLSRASQAALKRASILVDDYLRMPIQVTEADFLAADHVIAVKEAEHRPMMSQAFPALIDRVEFWHVHDLDCCGPEEALPHLEREVTALLDRLAAKSAS